MEEYKPPKELKELYEQMILLEEITNKDVWGTIEALYNCAEEFLEEKEELEEELDYINNNCRVIDYNDLDR